MLRRIRHWILLAGIAASLGGGVTACHRHETGEKKAEAPPVGGFHPQIPAPKDALSAQIESVTGGHTRVVWNECQTPRDSDPFSHSDQQVLRGIDTRDGLGERTLITEKGNYSRPVITPDGATILYSWRRTVKKKGHKDYAVTVMRTDWRGREPEEIASGYVVDVWADPKTGVEWVYCVRKYPSVHGPALVARQLLRFRLDDPKDEEIVYDEGRLTPDNIQISRDGKFICGQFPWPRGGVLHMDEHPPRLRQLAHGCWTSCAPDDSGVTWVFDGGHKGATFFTSDGERSWYVPFDAPCSKEGETYHPRWTNDARFMVLTGPYVPDGAGEQAVHSDRNKPEVYIGKFAPDASKVESWVQVSHNRKPAAYPDAWIEGGEKANLQMPEVKPKPVHADIDTWPGPRTGLIFVWKDRKAPNEWKDAAGHLKTAELDAKGAARYGRRGEMITEGGKFEVEDDEDAPQHGVLASGEKAAFEALLLPGAADEPCWLLRTPTFSVYAAKGAIGVVAADGKALQAPAPDAAQALHVAVNRNGSIFELFLNGAGVALQPCAAPADAPSKKILLGSRKLARGMSHIAIYGRALSAEEISADARVAAAAAASGLPPAPQVQLIGRLVEASKIPTLESIEPYTSALLSYVYEVRKVESGELTEKRVLVKHWGLLNRNTVAGFPRKIGEDYPLTIERESDHGELQGERVSDDTSAFDLTPWFDVTAPQIP